MIATLILITLIVSGWIATVLWPVHLPADWLVMIRTFGGAIRSLDGILPVSAFLTDVVFCLFIVIMFLVARFIIGLVSMPSGSGKPEL